MRESEKGPLRRSHWNRYINEVQSNPVGRAQDTGRRSKCPGAGGKPGARWAGARSQGQGWRERGIQRRKWIVRHTLLVRVWPFLREIRCYRWLPASSTLSG